MKFIQRKKKKLGTLRPVRVKLTKLRKLFKILKSPKNTSSYLVKHHSNFFDFGYNDIKMGSIYNEKLNDISIITLPNTKNIITMYPVNKVDENLNDVEQEKPKTKRLSQIDKFNKKYQQFTSN